MFYDAGLKINNHDRMWTAESLQKLLMVQTLHAHSHVTGEYLIK